MQAYGLKTHIWNNNLRSILLLILFPILLLGLSYAVLLIYLGVTSNLSLEEGAAAAIDFMPSAAPVALGAAGGWFAIAFVGHQKLIDLSTKARSVTPAQEPRAYRLLENLCISRGITMPRLKIIETPVLNAYASGIRDSNYTVTLTPGLMGAYCTNANAYQSLAFHRSTSAQRRGAGRRAYFLWYNNYCHRLSPRHAGAL